MAAVTIKGVVLPSAPVPPSPILAAFHEAALADPPPPPAWSGERGVVIVGGAGPYAASTYVTLAMLRESGCTLPVEVWHLASRGEYCPRFAAACERFGPLEWIDADAHARHDPLGLFRGGFLAGCEGGWQAKAYALAHTRFGEALLLDADCYPIHDPSIWFDRGPYLQAGAIFWPDLAEGPGNLSPQQYAHFGVAGDGRGWESGQIFLDRRRHWPALCLALWLNAQAHIVYRLIYGDKDCFQMAWRRLGASYWMHEGRPAWHQVAFVHAGPDRFPLFVHRCRDKFRAPGQSFASTTQNRRRPYYVAVLPGERRAHDHYADWLALTDHQEHRQ